MTPFTADAARLIAQFQIDTEDHLALVEREKARLRLRRGKSWWHTLFPFQIKITRRS